MFKQIASSMNILRLSEPLPGVPGKASDIEYQKIKKAYGAAAEILEKSVNNSVKLSSGPLLMNREAKLLAEFAHLGRFVSKNI